MSNTEQTKTRQVQITQPLACTTPMCVTSYFKMWFIASTSSPPFSFRLLCVGLASGHGGRAALDRFTFTGFSFFNISFPQLITRTVLCHLEGASGVSRRPISANLPPQFLNTFTVIFHPLVSKCFGWTASLRSTAHFRTLECRASRCWDFFGWQQHSGDL